MNSQETKEKNNFPMEIFLQTWALSLEKEYPDLHKNYAR